MDAKLPDRSTKTAASDGDDGQDDEGDAHNDNRTGSDSRGLDSQLDGDAEKDETRPMHPPMHPNAPMFTTLAGWRTEVNLTWRQWRYAKGSKKTRRLGRYRPLGTVPGGEGRLSYAKQNSERQKAQRAAKHG